MVADARVDIQLFADDSERVEIRPSGVLAASADHRDDGVVLEVRVGICFCIETRGREVSVERRLILDHHDITAGQLGIGKVQ